MGKGIWWQFTGKINVPIKKWKDSSGNQIFRKYFIKTYMILHKVTREMESEVREKKQWK